MKASWRLLLLPLLPVLLLIAFAYCANDPSEYEEEYDPDSPDHERDIQEA